MADLKQKLGMEFVGTFFLTLVVATGGSGVAVGAVLMVMVYCGGHISGACYNPCVALAQLLKGVLGDGKKDFKTFGLYLAAEFLGALAAAIIGYAIRPEDNLIACVAPNEWYNVLQHFIHSMIWTAALAYVVLTSAFEEETKDKYFYGWCIGMILWSGITAPGIDGGGHNPALSTGLLVTSIFLGPDNHTCDDNLKHIWIFLLAPMAGGALGWLFNKITNEKDGKLAAFAPYIQEALGVFYLVYHITGGGLSAFSVGTTLGVLVFCGGHVSGGQYNPAVSLGVWVRGAQDLKKTLIFIAVQLVSAFVGAFVGYLMTRYGGDVPDGTNSPAIWFAVFADNQNVLGGILCEFFGCMLWVYTVLATATTEKVASNSFFGWAVGYAVLAAGASLGTSTGGAFNPAFWFGNNLVELFADVSENDAFGEIIWYWLAHVGAAFAAGFLYRFLNDGAEFQNDQFSLPCKKGNKVATVK